MDPKKLNLDIFRQYDIRGIADTDLSNEVVESVAKALVTYAVKKFDKRINKVAIGNDMRLSSDRIRDALIHGFTEMGVDVVELGMVPTAVVYFTIFTHDVDAVIQVTGSHNPAEYNGLKMMIGDDTLYGDDILAIRDIVRNQSFVEPLGKKGVVEKYSGIVDEYLDWIKDNVKLGERKLKVVVDCGNGVGGVCAEKLIETTLGQEAIPLFTTPDGTFPNHHPDPTVPANLQDLVKAVKEHKADVGVAYDGDADRIGICDENGEILFGDTLLILLSRAVLAENPGATIIGEVKCSQKLFDDIKKHGGVPIMGQVGHSIMKAKLRETGAKLAGEVSGHIFFNDKFFGFDDGLYATARLIEILSNTDKTVSELLADLPTTYFTPELRVECREDAKFEVPKIVAKHYEAEGCETTTIDGVRILFKDGWALCRASNTQPELSLRVEANSEARRDELLAELRRVVKEAEATLEK